MHTSMDPFLSVIQSRTNYTALAFNNSLRPRTINYLRQKFSPLRSSLTVYFYLDYKLVSHGWLAIFHNTSHSLQSLVHTKRRGYLPNTAFVPCGNIFFHESVDQLRGKKRGRRRHFFFLNRHEFNDELVRLFGVV